MEEHYDHTDSNFALGEIPSEAPFGTRIPVSVQEYRAKKAAENMDKQIRKIEKERDEELGKLEAELKKKIIDIEQKEKNPVKRAKKIEEAEKRSRNEGLSIKIKAKNEIGKVHERAAFWNKRAGTNPLKRAFSVDMSV